MAALRSGGWVYFECLWLAAAGVAVSLLLIRTYAVAAPEAEGATA